MGDEDKSRFEIILIDLVAKVGALSEGLKAFKEEIKSALTTHTEHCRQDMGDLYQWQKEVNERLGFQNGVEHARGLRAKLKPHWVHVGTIIFCFLMGLYFGRGGGH